MKPGTNRKQRVVIKVGTSILTSRNGNFSREHVEKVSAGVLEILKDGHEAVVVSSGAIGCGMDVLGIRQRPKELPVLQACAAVGQGKLMKYYEDFFSRRKFHTAQVLLTRDGVQDRERYLNVRHTLGTLLRMKILPIVNENDTVATEEIRFGDNDTLSALVGSLIEADLLIILSDVDGFYLKDKTRLEEVRSLEEIDKDLRGHLFQNKREKTTGGMETKLDAARFAMCAGVTLVIANGHEEGILKRVLDGEPVGTRFHANEKKRSLRESWLAFSHAKGEIQVDEGARRALLQNGKSLLPSGILRLHGNFELGDAVKIVDSKNSELARGLVNYSRRDLDKIKGCKTGEISALLGYKFYDEVVHRDNLVILRGDKK